MIGDSAGSTRAVDLRVGLPWLLSSATGLIVALATLVWSVAMASHKIELLILSVNKVETRLEDRDAKLERLQNEIHAGRLVNELQNQRLGVIEDSMRALTDSVRR